MPSTYDIGDLVTVIGTFTNSTSTGGPGGVADPTTVNFLYDTPSSTAPTTATRTSTSTGSVGGISKLSTGLYLSTITSTGSGLYEYRFTSTGTVAASGESWFSVRPQRVTT
jgi:hypothetical protein